MNSDNDTIIEQQQQEQQQQQQKQPEQPIVFNSIANPAIIDSIDTAIPIDPISIIVESEPDPDPELEFEPHSPSSLKPNVQCMDDRSEFSQSIDRSQSQSASNSRPNSNPRLSGPATINYRTNLRYKPESIVGHLTMPTRHRRIQSANSTSTGNSRDISISKAGAASIINRNKFTTPAIDNNPNNAAVTIPSDINEDFISYNNPTETSWATAVEAEPSDNHLGSNAAIDSNNNSPTTRSRVNQHHYRRKTAGFNGDSPANELAAVLNNTGPLSLDDLGSTVYVNFCARDHGSSVLFHEERLKSSKQLYGPNSTVASVPGAAAAASSNNNLFEAADRLITGGLVFGALEMNNHKSDLNDRRFSNITAPVINNIPSSSSVPSTPEINKSFAAAIDPDHPAAAAADANFIDDFSLEDSLILPLWTRTLRYLLMSIGVVRMGIPGHFPHYLSYAWSLLVFLFFLFNVFFVATNVRFQNTNESLSSGLKLLAQICTNISPLLAWVSSFFYIGWSTNRSMRVWIQLKNLEQFKPNLVRLHVIGAVLIGLLFMSISLGTLPKWDFSSSITSFFYGLNIAGWLLLNYFIVSFVVLTLCSLVCRFHDNSLILYQDSLFTANLTVSEAIREHIVLMRLTRVNSEWIQWIIGPTLIAYCTGFLLAGYLMISSGDYTTLPSAVEQLILALLLVMIPLYAAAGITATCRNISRLVQDIDLIDNLIARHALLQELVLLPVNGYKLFELTITYDRLGQLLYIILGALLILIRGAFFKKEG